MGAKKDMSAQPIQHHATVRVLIAADSENSAYALDSALRDAGIATKLSISDDLAHIGQLLTDGDTDIAILSEKVAGLDTTLPRFRANAPNTPLLLLTNAQESSWTVRHALNLGATDAIPSDQLEHLAMVVRRELKHVCQQHYNSQLRRALKEAEERCQLLLQESNDAIAYVHEGMHIHANEGYLRLFGYADLDDLSAASLVDLLDADSVDALKSALKQIRSGADEVSLAFRARNDSGSEFARTMKLTNSQYDGEACLQVTVEAREPAADVPTPAAPTPSVGGVEQELGLSGFVRAAETLFSSTSEESYVLCIGLDHFGQSLDAYGLLGGESIARTVWQHVQSRAEEFPIARINAHQFAMAVTTASWDRVNQLADQIRTSVCALSLDIQDRTLNPSVSITGALFNPERGVAPCLDDAFDQQRRLLEEEAANCTAISSPFHNEEDGTDDARVVLREITHAIENKMFVLLFQPIISLRGDADEHYEVFLRMLNEEGEQVEPARFLQTAIENNVAGKIDRWVILQAIKMLSVHRAKGNTTRLTINVSANSIIDPDFPEWLSVAIKAARLPSDAVIFQITEKDATSYLRQSREFVERLRKMHYRASLSRFGLIQEPMETLRHILVDMVKLDGSYIDGIDDSEAPRQVMVETINRLQSFGKLTVVPMVENASTLSTLWQAGANYIQGQYLQGPTTDMDYDFSTDE